MNPLSNSSQAPNIGSSSLPPKIIVNRKESHTEEPFDAGMAKQGVTPHEAIMGALSGKIDAQNLNKLKVNGKFEQQDGSFGGNEAVADIHFSGDVAYFKFNLMWVVQAEDTNKKRVTVIVKQEIFTNVKIPPETATSAEMNEAKQRAFKLAKSFELLQKMAVTNKSSAKFSPDNLNEIRDLATLTFTKTGMQDASGKVVEGKHLKLADKNIHLDFLNEESKHTKRAAAQVFTRSEYMETVAVYFRSEKKSAFSQRRPFSPSSSSPPPTSSPSTAANSPPPRPTKAAPTEKPVIPPNPSSDKDEDEEFFDVEEEDVFFDVEEAELNVGTSPSIVEEGVGGIKKEECFQRAENALKNYLAFLGRAERVAEAEQEGQEMNPEDSALWLGVLEARKASVNWLKTLDKLNQIISDMEQEDEGAGLFPKNSQELETNKEQLERESDSAYKQLLEGSPFVRSVQEYGDQVWENLETIKKNHPSEDDVQRIKKIEDEALVLAARFKIIISTQI